MHGPDRTEIGRQSVDRHRRHADLRRRTGHDRLYGRQRRVPPRRGRLGRPVRAGARQRRLRRLALRPRRPLRPVDGPADRSRRHHGHGHPGPVPVQPGPGRPDRQRGHRCRRTSRPPARRRRAGGDPARRAPARPAVHRGGRLRGCAHGCGRRVVGQRGFPAHRRRRCRARPTRLGRHLVPGQRPPVGQGHLRPGGDRPGRPGRTEQRCARPEEQRRRLDHLALVGARPDGQLPEHPGDRRLPGGDRHARRPTDGHGGGGEPARERRRGQLTGPHRGDRRLPGQPVRPVPVRLVRRDRGRRRPDRVRAGDPVPPGLRTRLLRGRPTQPERGGARAGPPVVRRQCVADQVERHLAQRGLRQLRGVAVGGARRRPDRATQLRAPVRGDRLVAAVGRAGPGVDVRLGRLQAGALAVHALRRTLGDDTFFRLLRTWTSERAAGNATTSDLVALAERVAGRQLRPLFDAWLVGGSAPTLP